MANKMLIDAAHPEETRVVVLRGNRVEEFDFESAHRKQLRGNIYLAKVTRVEPSLQAAFVDYGGNRHGFLAFSEIHPDYYQIPVADRQALIDEEERAQRAAEDEADRSARRRGARRHAAARREEERVQTEPVEAAEPEGADGEAVALEPAEPAEPEGAAPTGAAETAAEPAPTVAEETEAPAVAEEPPAAQPIEPAEAQPPASGPGTAEPYSSAEETEADAAFDAAHGLSEEDTSGDIEEATPEATGAHSDGGEPVEKENGGESADEESAEEIVESVGGADALEEVPDRAPRYRRQYKIQEVIKRRQVMLVQVVKEERGTKGAALTTYLSLAGRYSVLMPNTARGGGISRKITSADDRLRLKEIAQDLEVPEGMGMIVRTAGASRTKTEIKRDFEYLLRLWETVRDLTLKSTAPKLVYEEGSLVKRSIRDLYSKDIDEVTVAGVEAYHEAKDFMRMLMPSHAKNVRHYADTQPLLSRYGVESQLDAMFSPVVQLRSGGYIVLNQAEALVAIDVNSGRATREHHIEDTALKTNLEAADEIARQLRLRDLAGLIVIDFIDMDEKRNNRAVERRLKECLKQDRARIQVGRISHFGLLEMSRQRIRASVLESSTEKCPYCAGTGHVRSVSSLALQVLRALEEQLIKGATHNLITRTRPDVALYVLNQKRAHLRALEERFAITITVAADDTVTAPQAFVIDRGEQVHSAEAARALAEQAEAVPAETQEVAAAEEGEEAAAAGAAAAGAAEEAAEQSAGMRRRRRRRRRGASEAPTHEQPSLHEETGEVLGEMPAEAKLSEEAGPAAITERTKVPPESEHRRRRRGRRGGRRNRLEREATQQGPEEEFEPGQPDMPAALEPGLKDAVADLDAASNVASSFPKSSAETRIEPTPEPPSAETVQAVAPAEPETPPRRRSTVREAAFVAGAEASSPPVPPSSAAPAPEPVVTESGKTENADGPRRTGWWSRRLADG